MADNAQEVAAEEIQVDNDDQPPIIQRFLTGAALVVEDEITEENSLRQVLHWIGFRTAAQKQALVNDCFTSWIDLRMLSEKDASTMEKSFSSRTNADGRLIFGTTRTKYIKAVIHWIQDFYRVSDVPSIIGLSEITFKTQLQRALTRSMIRKNLKDQVSSTADAATPGPLLKENQWKEWEEKFINYAKAHIGAAGVPLSYVIRDNQEPDVDSEHSDFISRTIACAPLEGESYQADRLTVFNFIVSFTTGHPSGDWVKNTLRYSDGRRSMKALRDHFAGEGNATRSLAEAERLKDTLHYKSERAMPFETFLTNCQKMFFIFDKEGEPLTEEAQIRFLFKSIHHADLQATVEALKAQRIGGADLSYVQCANHLATAVSELPEYVAKNRNISATDTRGSKGTSSIYAADGTIRTGHIENWKQLSNADKKIVYNERKRLGVKFQRKDDSSLSSTSTSAGSVNTIKQLKQALKKSKRQIMSLKRGSSSNNNDIEGNTKNDDDDDAGDQFGGKSTKRSKKN